MLRAKPRTLKFLCAGAVCLLIACVLFGFRIFRWEPESIEVNHYDVLLKNWHGEHSGLRFVIVSDIHQLALPEDIARLKRIVRLVNDENPDVIFTTWRFHRGAFQLEKEECVTGSHCGGLKKTEIRLRRICRARQSRLVAWRRCSAQGTGGCRNQGVGK